MKENGPLRSCIGCREVREKRNLVRFVLSPEKELVLDYYFKLPGRAAYLCPDWKCIEKAVNIKALNKAFREGVKKPSAATIARAITDKAKEKIRALLLLAAKSGKLTMGSASVDRVLKRGDGNLVLLCPEMSEKAKEEWKKKADKLDLACTQIPVVDGMEKIVSNRNILNISDAGFAKAIAEEIDRIERVVSG